MVAEEGGGAGGHGGGSLALSGPLSKFDRYEMKVERLVTLVRTRIDCGPNLLSVKGNFFSTINL